MTLKNLARQGLNRFRQVRNKVKYQRRIKSVPEITLESEKNILIMTVDCLRNDRLSRNGHHRETTPFLDSMAESTAAISAAPWTFSSVPSILTGLHPHNHGAVYQNDTLRGEGNLPHLIDDEIYTLPELLAQVGYETHFLTAIGTAAVPVQGRFQNNSRNHDAEAGELLAQLDDWWHSTPRPKFGYVQLGDLHEPLHEPEDPVFGDIPSIEGLDRWRFTDSTEPKIEFETYRDGKGLLYDSLLRQIDRQIQEFLQGLEDRRETIVIVTSDHGEEFWEFQEFERANFDTSRGIVGVGHGHALVPPVIEVPILTESFPIADVNGMASSTDIVPSILTELGVGGTNEVDGEVLQREDYIRPIISQETAYGENQISVTYEGKHLIYVPSREKSVLLDYESGEIVQDKQVTNALQEHIPDGKQVGESTVVSGETQQQLEDLGYMR